MKELIRFFIFSVVIACLFFIVIGGLQMMQSTHNPRNLAFGHISSPDRVVAFAGCNGRGNGSISIG